VLHVFGYLCCSEALNYLDQLSVQHGLQIWQQVCRHEGILDLAIRHRGQKNWRSCHLMTRPGGFEGIGLLFNNRQEFFGIAGLGNKTIID
jgi:hypothetical protein